MIRIMEGVFKEGKKLFTKNLVRGYSVYGEKLVLRDNTEFRNWDPNHSKLAAGIIKGLNPNLKRNSVVLYLGAASGTTLSHISDIVVDGFVFGVEFADRVMRELYLIAEQRHNVGVLLMDANEPLNYVRFLSMVDLVYQDIAQKNQVDIFVKNMDLFLRKNGFGILCVKARSIDVTKKPRVIFKSVRNELSKHYKIIDYKTLEPYQRDHAIFLVKK